MVLGLHRTHPSHDLRWIGEYLARQVLNVQPPTGHPQISHRDTVAAHGSRS